MSLSKYAKGFLSRGFSSGQGRLSQSAVELSQKETSRAYWCSFIYNVLCTHCTLQVLYWDPFKMMGNRITFCAIWLYNSIDENTISKVPFSWRPTGLENVGRSALQRSFEAIYKFRVLAFSRSRNVSNSNCTALCVNKAQYWPVGNVSVSSWDLNRYKHHEPTSKVCSLSFVHKKLKPSDVCCLYLVSM